jgi:thiol-disulfide isomerase/thioredoxin
VTLRRIWGLIALAGVAGCAGTANQPASGPFMAAFPLEARSGLRRVTVGLWKPSFSPDGTRLAVGRTGGGIEVVDLATGARDKLTLFGIDPAWSPDGRFIAFGAPGDEVWVVEPAGGQPRKVAPGAFPSWSADGKRLFVVSRPGGEIFMLPIDDPAARPQPFFAEVKAWYPAVSPDETRVAMGLDGELIVVERESGIEVSRVNVGRGGQFVSWSPDGKWVAYGAFSPDGISLYNPDTHQSRTVVLGPFTIPTFSRDGKLIAFDQRLQGTNDVWVTDKFYLGSLGTIGRPRGILKLTGNKPEWRWRKVRLGELDLRDLGGRQWRLRDLEGKVALVNVWASWCGPCTKELPLVQKLHDSLKGRADTVVLSLNIDDDPEKARKYATDHKLTFPVLPASKYVSGLVGGVSIPRSWIVEKGMLTSESVGFHEGQEDAWLKEVQAQLDRARSR